MNALDGTQPRAGSTAVNDLPDVIDVTRHAAERRAAAAKRASRSAARQQRLAALRRQQAREHRWVLPVANYRFSSGFGGRWGRMHEGNDLAAPIGTPVHALSKGTVVFAGTQNGYGNKVEIRHWDGTVTWYAHMSTISARVGDDVLPGDVIGAVGNTGRSTGPHLHLQVHRDGQPVNPRAWLASRGVLI